MMPLSRATSDGAQSGSGFGKIALRILLLQWLGLDAPDATRLKAAGARLLAPG